MQHPTQQSQAPQPQSTHLVPPGAVGLVIDSIEDVGETELIGSADCDVYMLAEVRQKARTVGRTASGDSEDFLYLKGNQYMNTEERNYQ